jgi:lipoate-protein ligase A
MTKIWRLILDDKCNGYYNMAVDEALLRFYPRQKIPTLRIYGWQSQFISIGYHQKSETFLSPHTTIPFVRRITGGAAILHADEITYSIALSTSDLDLPIKVKDSFRVLCSFLMSFYRKLGLSPFFIKDIAPYEVSRCGAICFDSYEEYDISIRGRKIGGNAQRRSKNIIFQQGSIPQTVDYQAMCHAFGSNELQERVTFLDKLLGYKTNFYHLQQILAETFQETFCIGLEKGALSFEEEQLALRLLKRKYMQDTWNQSKAEGGISLAF